MEPDEIIALWFIFCRRRKKNKQRRNPLHPLLSARLTQGAIHLLFDELSADDTKFFNYFRMKKKSFNELLTILEPHIRKQDTNMRLSISPKERLAVTLRYLASGCTLTELQYNYRIGVSTLSYVIADVCDKIWSVMKDDCMPQPSTEEWERIASEFYKRTNFPNCIGAIDGKHIRIIKPENSGTLFFNYKHFFSIVLLAVADANYRFLAVDIGAYGKSSDSSVFANSNLWKNINSNNLQVPNSVELPGTDKPKVPFVFVADEAFALTNHVMRPYGGKNLSVIKRIFNYRLSRARRYVECSFGILSNKWRIFHRPLNVSLQFAEQIVKACVILHNFVRVRDGIQIDDSLTIEGLSDIDHNASSTTRAPLAVRETFANFFVGPGKLSWQNNKI